MDQKYKLLTNVVKSNHSRSMDTKFSKLTLGSKKIKETSTNVTHQNQQQSGCLENIPKNITKVVYDSEQETTVNRILKSSSTENLSRRLELSDSDETICSTVTQNDDESDKNDSKVDKHIKNHSITGDHNDIECRMSNLEIADTEDLFKHADSSKNPMGNLLSQKQISTKKLSEVMQVLNIERPVEQQYSNFLSGTTISILPKFDRNVESVITTNLNDTPSEVNDPDDIISISDSEPENLINQTLLTENSKISIDKNEISLANSLPVSSVASSHIGLSPTIMAKVDQFFNNIPLLVQSESIEINNTNNSSSAKNSELIDEYQSQRPSCFVEETSIDESFNSTHDPTQYDSVKKILCEDEKNTNLVDLRIGNTENKSPFIKQSHRIVNIENNNQSLVITPKHQQKQQKSTPTINISAKINIKIHLPDSSLGSSATSSRSSRSIDQSSTSIINTSNNNSSAKIQLISNKIKMNSEKKSIILTTPTKNKHQKEKLTNSAKKTITNNGNNQMKKKPASERNNLQQTPFQDEQHVNLTHHKVKCTATNKATETDTNPFRHLSDYNVEKSHPPTTVNNEEFVIDETAEAILNELYGHEWKTPTLKQMCSSRKKKRPMVRVVVADSNLLLNKKCINFNKQINEETISNQTSALINNTFLDNFCKYRENVSDNLESTRISPSLVTSDNCEIKHYTETNLTSKINESPYFKERPTKLTELNSALRLRSCSKTATKKQVIHDILLLSDEETDQNSDDAEWRDTDNDDGNSKDNDEVNSFGDSSDKDNKRKNRKKGKTRPIKDKLIYFDLTNREVEIERNHSNPNATVTELELITQKYLKKFEYKENANQPIVEQASENTIDEQLMPKNTKRKLFTPSYEYVKSDDTTIEENKEIHSDNAAVMDSTNDDVELKLPIPSYLNPINRLLENVKRNKAKTPAKSRPSSKKQTDDDSPKILKSSENTIIDKYSRIYGFLQSLDENVPKECCHPDAVPYRNNFRKTRTEITDRLYKLFNVTVFDSKLTIPITWNKKLLNTAGRCHNKKRQGIRSSRIELSDKVLTNAERLRSTLIHEMCHAATWIFNEETGHGNTWKKWASHAMSQFPELPKITVCHEYSIEYKYTYKCTLCEANSQTHSKSKKVENIRCAYCHGQIEIFLNKKNKNGLVILTPTRQANGFAKFVKEQYKQYKLPGHSHSDVMKLLSAAFAAVKLNPKNGMPDN